MYRTFAPNRSVLASTACLVPEAPPALNQSPEWQIGFDHYTRRNRPRVTVKAVFQSDFLRLSASFLRSNGQSPTDLPDYGHNRAEI